MVDRPHTFVGGRLMRCTFAFPAVVAALLAGPSWFVGPAVAQQAPEELLPQPRLETVFPPGVQAGQAVEVTVAGTDLEDATELLFARPGLKAVRVPKPEPKIDPKTKKPVVVKKNKGDPDTAKFTITAAADVPPGAYDVRVVDAHGVSNPRLFMVGRLPELTEAEPNNDVPQAQTVEPGTVVNGTFSKADDVDFVQFTGKAGGRFLAYCATTSIDSMARPFLELYSTDGQRIGLNRNYAGNDALLDVTLPKDDTYILRISEFAYQNGGREYFYRLTVGLPFHVDGVFPPAVNPGKPTALTVFGRNLPDGSPSPLTIDGRPVDTTTVSVNGPSAIGGPLNVAARIPPTVGLTDGFEYRLPTPDGPSAPITVFLTDLPVVLEAEADNDSIETARLMPAPVEVAGRIEKRTDRDFYAFPMTKGETFIVSLLAERAGADMDTYFQLRTSENKAIGPEQDDDANPLHPVGFYDRSGDPPSQTFTAPADGKFYVFVGSRVASVNFGPRCVYRLQVRKPTPDFRAVVMPRSRNLPTAAVLNPKGDMALDVFVERRHGFDDPVTFTADNLPAGVTAIPAIVGTGAQWGTLVLTATADAKSFTGPIGVTATAEIDGKPVTRPARPATITWATPGKAVNIPTIARLDQQFVLAVRPDPTYYRLTTDVAKTEWETKDDKNKPVKKAAQPPFFVQPGDKLTIPVRIEWQAKEGRANPVTVDVEPYAADMRRAAVTVAKVTMAKGKDEMPMVLTVQPKADPGTYVIAVRGETQVDVQRHPDDDPKKKSKLTVPAHPAEPITVTVLPTTLAKLSAKAPGGNDLKPGGSADIAVTVDRQFNYAGPFAVTVEFPEGSGLTAKPVTLPAGASTVAVPVTAAKDAKVGGVSNVVVTAVATVHDKFPVSHEAKLNLNVAKPDQKK